MDASVNKVGKLLFLLTILAALVSIALPQTASAACPPLEDFIAVPTSGSTIDLAWDDPTDNVLCVYKTLIKYTTGTYPADPPTSSSTQCYYQDGSLGGHSVTVGGLVSGTTYYFRIWRYNETLLTYTLDDQDYATTLSGVDTPDTPGEPDEWNQDPTCDLYMHLPIISVMNATASSTGLPAASMCLIVTLVGIGLVSAASYPLARLSGQPTSRTIAIPVLVTVLLIFVAAIVHAVPLMFVMFALVLAAGVAYLWTRA